MAKTSKTKNASLGHRFRELFTTRDLILHDGRDLKRFSIAGRTQALVAGVATVTVAFSAYGVAQATVSAIMLSGVTGAPATPQQQMETMRVEMQRMRADVDMVREAAKAHAARIEQRQATITALISGKSDRAAINQTVPAIDVKTSAIAAEVLAPLHEIEARQLKLAAKARVAGEARFAAAASHLRKMGLSPERYIGSVVAMGGPFEPAEGGEGAAVADAEAQFRSLFLTWKKMDVLEQTVISIPSQQPVDNLVFTSNFGVRADPFRGTAAMHAGVDIPGPIGSPIYATADGIVSVSGRQGGYGNLVQINHGKGIETRYGHLSKILVPENTRVRRGQLIGLMGSTGRSTGSHLHYEVRVDGRAVNPMPFLQNVNFLEAAQDKALKVSVGGPVEK